MALTDLAIRAAKPREKAYKLSDEKGLQLLVSPAGGRLWRLAYRFDGKQKQLAIGPYPEISLKDARDARDAARKMLEAGIDPSADKQRKRAEDAARRNEEAANSFKAVADDLLVKKTREGLRPRTLAKFEWLVALASDLHARPVKQITAPEVLDILQAVEARGNLETARRLRTTIGEVMRYAIATGRAVYDPTFATMGALAKPQTKNRAAIVDPTPFGALLRAIRGYVGRPETRMALELTALTAARPGEIRLAEWKEFDLEAEQPCWTIPAGRMKMNREHRLPLAPQAVVLLRELHPLTGRFRLLFPGVRTPDRALSENTLSAALRTLGYAADEVCPHGFRSTFSTMATESGLWSEDAIEAALAHSSRNKVRKAYMRSVFWQERIKLANWWADQLDLMREGGKVVPLKREA